MEQINSAIYDKIVTRKEFYLVYHKSHEKWSLCTRLETKTAQRPALDVRAIIKCASIL